jgi:hypothetical protein
MLLEFCAGQIAVNCLFQFFDPKFKMKTPETLNAKLAYVFHRFATNNCMSHASKPSNSYGHWKTTRGEIFNENLETD